MTQDTPPPRPTAPHAPASEPRPGVGAGRGGALSLRPLHPAFGVEALECDLREVASAGLYPEIRAAFEAHSAILFRDQQLAPEDHLRLAQLFGPIEDRNADARGADAPFEIPEVSNLRDDGALTAPMDAHTLHLKANQLWHTDGTFLPTPALANILVARIPSAEGGETELAATRAAWRQAPEALKAETRGALIWHRYAHSRAKISSTLAEQAMFTKWRDQCWPALWRNPVTGEDAVYIASHAFAVAGRPSAEGTRLIEALIAHCTQPAYVYRHRWRAGDVLIWDERATLHRGRPWPLDQPRVLASLCVSVTAADGLDAMRAAAAAARHPHQGGDLTS